MSDRLTIQDKLDMLRFWRTVVYEMGSGWVLDEPAMEKYMPAGENWYHFEAVLTNGTFDIHARNNFYGNPGMWHCFPTFTRDHAGRVNTPYGVKLVPTAINISEKKSPSEVARELNRRAVSGWQEFAGHVINLNAQVDSSWDLRRAACNEVAATFGLRVQQSSSSDKEPYIYTNDRFPQVLKLEPGGEGKFYFKISGADVEQTKKILAILEVKD